MGIMYRITKSYGRWSSSTQVEGPVIKDDDKMVLVYHAATKQAFEIPPSYLTKVRKRG